MEPMPTNTLQFIGVLVSLVGLFGWVLKLMIPYLFRKLDERDVLIQGLTKDFLDATNHKTTEFTSAILDLKSAINTYGRSVDAQTEVFKQLIRNDK